MHAHEVTRTCGHHPSCTPPVVVGAVPPPYTSHSESVVDPPSTHSGRILMSPSRRTYVRSPHNSGHTIRNRNRLAIVEPPAPPPRILLPPIPQNKTTLNPRDRTEMPTLSPREYTRTTSRTKNRTSLEYSKQGSNLTRAPDLTRTRTFIGRPRPLENSRHASDLTQVRTFVGRPHARSAAQAIHSRAPSQSSRFAGTTTDTYTSSLPESSTVEPSPPPPPRRPPPFPPRRLIRRTPTGHTIVNTPAEAALERTTLRSSIRPPTNIVVAEKPPFESLLSPSGQHIILKPPLGHGIRSSSGRTIKSPSARFHMSASELAVMSPLADVIRSSSGRSAPRTPTYVLSYAKPSDM